MASFFSNLVSGSGRQDYQGAPTSDMGKGPKNMDPPSAGTRARQKWEAHHELFHGDEDDKPRQVAKPIYAPPPPKTVEQFYAELSNKANWGPLPSLGMSSSGNKNKPSYKDVELREGGEVRSLFQPYG